MSEPFATFVIPSIGRPTLARALQALQVQTSDRWRAIVALDGVEMPDCPRFTLWDRVDVVPLPKQEGKWGAAAARVRNAVLSRVQTPWVAFLDDDDVLSHDYLETLIRVEAGRDVVIFRSRHGPQNHELPERKGEIVGEWKGRGSPRQPRPPWLVYGNVTISFAVRMLFGAEFPIPPDDVGEDFQFLAKAWERGARVLVTDQVYYLQHQVGAGQRFDAAATR